MSAERFFRPFFDRVGAPPAMRRFVLEELSSPARAWHGLLHHALMLRALGKGDHAPGDMRRLILATLFHDIVYDARRADNEERSVEVAAAWLDPDDAAAVGPLILATKRHDLHADPPTRALLMADLNVLWTSSAALYGFYARGIRAEYAHVPDETYRVGRAAVLGALRDQLRAELDSARGSALDRNLDRELASLRAGT